MIKKTIKIYEILRFMAVGGVAAIIHYIIFIILLEFEVPYNFAYAVGLSIGLISNFFASNYFTFNTKPTIAKALKFAASNGINCINHMLLLNLFVHIGVNELIIPPLIFTTLFPLNFILVKLSLKGKVKKE